MEISKLLQLGDSYVIQFRLGGGGGSHLSLLATIPNLQLYQILSNKDFLNFQCETPEMWNPLENKRLAGGFPIFEQM